MGDSDDLEIVARLTDLALRIPAGSHFIVGWGWDEEPPIPERVRWYKRLWRRMRGLF